MPQIQLKQKDLSDIARTYGKVYATKIGDVCYTKLVDPQGFVLLAKDDQLRFYLFRKNLPNNKKGPWELVWGASSIVHDGLPASEYLIQWRLQHAFRAGKQGLNDAETLGRAELDAAAAAGTDVHKAAEYLVKDKAVVLAGRSKREIEQIVSVANFINEHHLRNSRNEMIVAFDRIIDGIRIVFAGTTDWVVEIYDGKKEKWETWLIDFKTSANVYLSHKLQALSYAAAVEQSYGLRIDRVGILLLGRDTKSGYTFVEVGKERYGLTFDHFVLVYRMLLLLNNGKLPAPTYKTYPTVIKLTQKEEEHGDGGNNINSAADPGSLQASDNRVERTSKSSTVNSDTAAKTSPRSRASAARGPKVRTDNHIRAQAGATA